MALMFYQWGLFNLPWWTILVALIVCTGIINAYNFMDGINGITGGYSWVVLLALAFINVQIVRFVEEDLIYTMLCAVLVFNFFNFRKKAKCFAGDVGSVSIAFVILFLIGKLIIRTENFSWIVLLVMSCKSVKPPHAGSPVHLPSTDISVSDVANQYFHVATTGVLLSTHYPLHIQ